MDTAFLDFPTRRAGRALTFPAASALGAHELLFWRPDRSVALYPRAADEAPWSRVLTPEASNRLVHDTLHWRSEFARFFARGGTLVLCCPETGPVGLHTLQEVIGYDFTDALPADLRFAHTACAPAAVEAPVGEPFRSLMQTIGPLFTARGRVDATDAQAIAWVAGTGRAAALYRHRHPGRLLVLPSLAASVDPSGEDALVDAVQALVARLRGGPASAMPPAHADESTALPEELAYRRELDDVLGAQRRLAQRQREIQARLDDLAALRALLVGDGRAAAQAAALALQALGAYAQITDDPEGALLFECDIGLGVLVVVAPEHAQHAPARLATRIAAACAGWSVDAPAALPAHALVVGPESALSPTPGPPRVSGERLLRAYRERDARLLAQLAGDAPAQVS